MIDDFGGSAEPSSALIEHAIEYFRDHRLPFKALRDGEVIITQATHSSAGTL